MKTAIKELIFLLVFVTAGIIAPEAIKTLPESYQVNITKTAFVIAALSLGLAGVIIFSELKELGKKIIKKLKKNQRRMK